MPSLTLDIKFGGKLHKRISNAVRDRINFSKREIGKRHDKWRQSEEAALAYLPEREIDAARRLKREDGKPQYTTIVIPYSYGVLMASHTYWTTVFLSRNPIMQYAGRHGETEMQVQALEALVDYQVNTGEMLVPFYIWLLDAGKYGLGVIGDYWVTEENVIAEVVEVEQKFLGTISTGKMKKQKITRRVKGYEGNRLYNVRPFDFFPDPRVSVANFQKGEFCGVYFELGWNTILRRRDQGFYTNTEHLKTETGTGIGTREPGSSQLQLPSSDSIFDELSSRGSADVVKGYEMGIELVPSVWGLGKGDSPEKWIFTTTSDYEVVIGAQPLGALHNKFPFQVIELEPEGYSITNRGIPEILKPINDTMDWLVNSHFYNVRKTLNNQFVVDPSRVVMKDVNAGGVAGGTIRLKPSAYGTNWRDAIGQFTVVDITRSHLSDIQFMNEIGQRAIGVNDQMLGMINQGGRKSATEVRTSSTFGINRLKTTAEYFSAMGWSPLSQMILQNTQQFYDAEKKFRLVGDLAEQAGSKFVEVTPENIHGFYDFVSIDGTLPVDRFAQANLWRELFGQMRQFPELLASYDIPKIFSWVAQLAGLKNINQFRVQTLPDEQVAAQAQKGNVVPLGGRDLDRVPTGQVSGTGPTG